MVKSKKEQTITESELKEKGKINHEVFLPHSELNAVEFLFKTKFGKIRSNV